MIELHNIKLSFGSRILIDGATARFECGSMTALLGRNGTGKSTLLRAMAALGKVQAGEIIIGGESVADMPSHRLARLVSFVNTERVDVEALTVYDLVAVGRAP
ncbi:MAG: ABC transporter ATP-binding protein, partial [Alistipes sp.]|nr:ABC transporter ATP-binding protein [Alistipes sp.]